MDTAKAIKTEHAVLLTVNDIARIFGVTVHTVRSWVCRGDPRLPRPIRYGRNFLRWRTEDVAVRLAELAEGKVTPMGHVRRGVAKTSAE